MPYFTDRFYNPSATYLAAKAVADDIEAARRKVASWLGARPNEIIFTAGGTEANNLAVSGIMVDYPKSNIVVSSIEHDSILRPAERYDCRIVDVHSDGRLNMVALENSIDDKTVLVSVMYANNEIGTIQPLRRVAEVLAHIKQNRQKRGIKTPLYFHTDACQAGNYLDLHVSRLGVDMMTLNGGKIYGPKQSGALFVKTGLKPTPLIVGGGHEKGLRSGTENVAAIMGFACALDRAQIIRQAESERLKTLSQLFINELIKALPAVSVNGSMKHRLPNNVHVTIPGQDNERLMMLLDEAGIQCAVGSACSASSDEPSHVLKAIGLSEELSRSSLRLTLGRLSSENDLRHVVKLLWQIVKA